MPSKTVTKFTSNMVKGLQPETSRYTLSCNGLQLRVTPAGEKTWAFVYYYGGRQRRLTIGRYPGVEVGDANEAVRNARKALDQMLDPAEERSKLKQGTMNQVTVSDLAEIFMKEKSVRLEVITLSDYQRLIDRHILPAFGNRDIKSIKRSDGRDLLNQMMEAGAKTQAYHAFSVLNGMWKTAIELDLTEDFPFFGLKRPPKAIQGKRYLTESEIPKFWIGLEKIRSKKTQTALKLLLLLMRREQELVGAMWKEFDLVNGLWFIPVRRIQPDGQSISSGLKLSGNRRSEADGLAVPLPPLALEVLLEWKKHSGKLWDHVFPNERNPLKSHTVNALGLAVRDHWKSSMALETSFTPHDLRRTAATHMARLKISRDLIERISGRVSTGVHGVYNRYDYLDEKQAALELWNKEVSRLVP